MATAGQSTGEGARSYQAISTKGGEDVYAKLRKMLGRRSAGQLANGGEDIVLGHRRSKVDLRIPTGWPTLATPPSGLTNPKKKHLQRPGR